MKSVVLKTGVDDLGDSFSDSCMEQLAEQLPGKPVFLNFNYDHAIGQVSEASLRENGVSVTLDLEGQGGEEVIQLTTDKILRNLNPEIYLAPIFVIEEKIVSNDLVQITKFRVIGASVAYKPCAPPPLHHTPNHKNPRRFDPRTHKT